jgi:hypothetical protein
MKRFVFTFLCSLLTGCLLTVSSMCSQQPETCLQYGLFETAFEVDLPYENPYFSASIQVDATITAPDQQTVLLPCFFDGTTWRMRYTPSLAGNYDFTIQADNGAETKVVHSGSFAVAEQSRKGFVRLSTENPRYFSFENGESYFPLGQNLGWVSWGQNTDLETSWKQYLDECHDAGIDWIRIWMCSWGKTEIVWRESDSRYYGYTQYSQENSRVLDRIFEMAEERDMYIQLCINHHGQYSTQSNPIWNENPYNAANGGFLRSPAEFFTSPEAMIHYKDRLRYLVARWGYSTHLLAWEFFNEVDLTSFNSWEDVVAWHETMSVYLRNLDPYTHLQTTSAAWQTHKTFPIQGMDFLQSHAYVQDVIGTLMSKSQATYTAYPDTLHFFGEMSLAAGGPNKGDRDGVILHNQLWASVHSWDAGTAMTWWWDNWVRPYNLYSHFKHLKSYITGIDWQRENLLPMETSVLPVAENMGDYIFAPGAGWAESDASEFVIDRDGHVDSLDQLSEFIHGNSHRDMAANPTFVFSTPESVTFRMNIEKIARAGAYLRLELDGEMVVSRRFASADQDYDPGEEGRFSLDIPAGDHRLHIRNVGNDWVQAGSFQIKNYVQRPVVFARGNTDRILVWVLDRPHRYTALEDYSSYAPTKETTVVFPGIVEGRYEIEHFDPYSGESTIHATVEAADDGLRMPLPSFLKDTAFRLKKVQASVPAFQNY